MDTNYTNFIIGGLMKKLFLSLVFKQGGFMKVLSLLVGFLLIANFAFADVTAKVIGWEKEIQNNGKPIIKVITEYKLDGVKVESNYPDKNWRTRYSAENFSQTKVLQDIKTHCEIGEHILKPIVEDDEILDMVRHHHERYDGNGYPDGLYGGNAAISTGIIKTNNPVKILVPELLLGAKILAVSDAYDAMTSNRSYREALSTEAACAEIKNCIGLHFDPEVVYAFLRIKEAQSHAFRSITSEAVESLR